MQNTKYKIQNTEHNSYISPAWTVPIYFPIQNEPRLGRTAPFSFLLTKGTNTGYTVQVQLKFTFIKINTNQNIYM